MNDATIIIIAGLRLFGDTGFFSQSFVLPNKLSRRNLLQEADNCEEDHR